MTSVKKLRDDIDTTKRELKNIRQEVLKQKANIKTETEKIKSFFNDLTEQPFVAESLSEEEETSYCMKPIGHISSCFKFKNGTPRQPSLCPTAKGTLKIEKSVFTNPEHSLIGLEEFSHVWILFVFHENGSSSVKAKVHPPRLNGASVGVFSSRSPHRPSPIGLSLCKLDKIQDDTLFLSGIDLLDGTPVLDIKPYIPMYDNPILFKESTSEDCIHPENEKPSASRNNEKLEHKLISEEDSIKTETISNSKEYKVPEFLKQPSQKLDVLFTNRALKDLEDLYSTSKEEAQVKGDCPMKQAIVEVLQNDPRSVYRREKCTDKLYYFYIDNVHVTCWFDESVAEVLKVKLSNVHKT